MNRDTENALDVWSGMIVGTFFGALFNSWIPSLAFMIIMLIFIIIKIFANRDTDDGGEK